MEDGIEPAGAAYTYDGREARVILPPTAAQRGGIQPVVQVMAEGRDAPLVRYHGARSLRLISHTLFRQTAIMAGSDLMAEGVGPKE